MNIKNLFKNYEAAKTEVDKIEYQEAATGATAETEAAWDEAYTKQHKAWMALKEEIKTLIGCSDDTAKRMIATRYDDLKALVERIA